MRVVAGRWRGRRLQAPAGEAVRPTTDRTKEALFSILGPLVEGAVVLDLCCGAGGLGIEALSRGAGEAVFVDAARSSLQAVRENLARCGAGDGTWQLVAGDAETWLRRWSGSAGRPWLLLCDPPYPTGIAAAMMSLVGSGTLPDGLQAAVVEYGPRTPDTETLPAGWRERRYGESRLAVFRPVDPAAAAEDAP